MRSVKLALYCMMLLLAELFLVHYVILNQKVDDLGDHLNMGVAIYYNPFKMLELYEYFVGAALIFISFVCLLLIRRWREGAVYRYVRFVVGGMDWYKVFVLLGGVLLNYFIVSDARVKVYFGVFYLIVLLVSPVAKYFVKYPVIDKRILRRYMGLVYAIPIFVSLFHFYGTLSDLVFERPKIMNEYFDVPETDSENGSVLSNAQFIAKYNAARLNKNLDKKYYAEDGDGGRYLKKNDFEIHWQVLDRFIIHHHNFILSPISDLELGKDFGRINAQYGLGSALIFKYIFSYFGGVTFQGWFSLWAIFYYVYYVLFLCLVFVVTRDIRISALILVLSISLLYLKSYKFIIIGPGESPWRHFFDIFIFYLLNLYQRRQRVVLLILALVLGVVSVFVNPQVGMMILFAEVVALMVYTLNAGGNKIVVAGLLGVSLACGTYLMYAYSSANDLAGYYLSGVIGFAAGYQLILLLLVVISFGYYFIYQVMNVKADLPYLTLMYLFFYSQGLLFYYVWHCNNDGLLSRSHIYVVTLVLMIYYYFRSRVISVGLSKGLVVGLYVTIALLFFNSANSVVREKRRYEEIFVEKKSYEWNFDRARILSVVDPVYFENSIALIHKYLGDNRSIYIISRYDNILSFLSKKYSMMPFFDLRWYHMTGKEVNKSIATIKRDKPKYIYVDVDLERDFSDEVIPRDLERIGYLHDESQYRVERIGCMKDVFEAVKDDYEICEKGLILSVYKKKGGR